ncbi:MAG TPA: secondary thiamine-phosphate synthase enzyme YjbQ [Oligoflexia bacterium]|nr:secondary thiamine-phosphate synthase enzyme YjbQ [Oligoflexia bacterium]
MVYQTEITVPTVGHRHIEDITGRVERIVKESGVVTGTVQVYNVGSTAAITTIEYEPGLCQDLGEVLDRLIPPGRDYGHERAWHDGNAHSHLQATLLGASFSAPVREGRLVVGTWQQIILIECDIKPRKRTLIVTVSGTESAHGTA